MSGNPAPRRQAGERIAPSLTVGAHGSSGHQYRQKGNEDALIVSTGDVSHCLNAGAMGRIDYETETMIAKSFSLDLGNLGYGGNIGWRWSNDSTITLDTNGNIGVAHTLRANHDGGEDGTGRGTPIVPVVAASLTRGAESAGKGGYAGRRQEDDVNIVAFDTTQITSKANRSQPKAGDPCHPLAAGAHAPCIAFDARQSDVIQYGDKTGPLDTDGHTMAIQHGWAVRRLIPSECEMLQGFKPGYTAVPYRGKVAADGPRYKALGNSMAVNAMRWLGRRIEMVGQS